MFRHNGQSKPESSLIILTNARVDLRVACLPTVPSNQHPMYMDGDKG